MATIERFEDMEIWQQARVLSGKIYKATGQGGFARDFGLRDQIRRAVVSVMSNIAEGFERGSNTEFIQFLYIAKGSAGEVRSQLCLACDLGYIEKDAFAQLNEELHTISKRVSGFIHYLRSTPMKGEKR